MLWTSLKPKFLKSPKQFLPEIIIQQELLVNAEQSNIGLQ